MPNLPIMDDPSWGQTPFMFTVGKDFKTQYEAIEYILDADKPWTGFGRNSVSGEDPTLANKRLLLSKYADDSDGYSLYTRPTLLDTRLGGNEAINCLWQFTADDDIINPLTANGNDKNNETGMGRLYSENYNTTQQLLHMCFGVPEYVGLANFYATVADNDLARELTNGVRTPGIAETLGSILGELGALAIRAITFPFKVMFAIKDIVATIVRGYGVTRYYDFNPQMPMYYRFVNTIMIHIATNMGIMPQKYSGLSENGFQLASRFMQQAMTDGAWSETAANNGSYSNLEYQEIWSDGMGLNTEGVPEFLKQGADIYTILSRRDTNVLQRKNLPTSDKSIYMDANSPDNRFGDNFMARAQATWQGANQFVGFRVDKNVDSSESFSNSTGESPIAGQINGAAQSAKSTLFSLMDGNTGFNFLDDIFKGLGEIGNKVVGSIPIAGNLMPIMSGNGLVEIPDMYLSSSYSKSYNFSMTLRSPYGDPVSLFQSLYVPLSMLLAGALPRSVGPNAYTSPFLVRAYCKGMLSVPMGIIDTITITRGNQEFGWNLNRLPLVLNISFSIKDLAPVMHMAAFTGSGAANMLKNFAEAIMGVNSGFQEYLMTLSGVGLNDRMLWSSRFFRKMNINFHLYRKETFNPLSWGTRWGDSFVGRIAGALSPYSRLSTN